MRNRSRALNAVVYLLIGLAVCLGGIAAWRRYSMKQSPDDVATALREKVERRIGAFMHEPSFADPKLWTAGLLRRTPLQTSDFFVCPQCRSSCWSPPGSRSPSCPFCGVTMSRQNPTISPVGGMPMVGGSLRPGRGTEPRRGILRWSGSLRPHGDRGICTNCHTMAISDKGISITLVAGTPGGGVGVGPLPGAGSVAANATLPILIRPGASRPHPDRGACTNCHTISNMAASPPALAPAAAQPPVSAPMQLAAPAAPKAIWRGVAAPAIPVDATKPVLIKAFGIEVCVAPGSGAKVSGVMGNSFASNAGLRAGDILIGFNNTRVHSVEQFQKLVALATVEADAKIKILREGRTLDLLIMVGEGDMDGFLPI